MVCFESLHTNYFYIFEISKLKGLYCFRVTCWVPGVGLFVCSCVDSPNIFYGLPMRINIQEYVYLSSLWKSYLKLIINKIINILTKIVNVKICACFLNCFPIDIFKNYDFLCFFQFSVTTFL